jgi:hypothetical protein
MELNKGEISRIIITQHDNGEVKAKSKGEKSVAEIIGLLEMAKNNILQSSRQDNPFELVPVTFDELDFEMDTEGALSKEGIKVGTTIKVARMTANMREERRKDYLSQKDK